jgi:ubiquitin-conjugating enzyme E2 J2
MATDICTRRLTKELQSLAKDPIKNPRIKVCPKESNILEMHYVIEGSADTPYHGGFYHGKLIFPKEYPLKPPSVMMCTPNGRFQPNRRLCLSMSDFHPESWNPMWSVSTILTGLYSFMIETAPTLGSIESTLREKQKLARSSLEYNVRDPTFAKLFPEYVELYQERLAAAAAAKRAHDESSTVPLSVDNAITEHALGPLLGHPNGHDQFDRNGLFGLAAGILAILAIVLSMMRFL